MHKHKRIIIVSIIVIVFFVIGWLMLSRPHQKKQEVGKYHVTESSALGTCTYAAQYNGKTIQLGKYPSNTGCHTTQSNAADKMLAIAGGQYTFFYDPSQDKVLTLDPTTIKAFQDFAQKKNVDINSYSGRRYFLNRANWQVLYQKPSGDDILTFTTKDNGKTFEFDPLMQE